MEILQDLFAAIGAILNGIPQGLLALSMGFSSLPTAIGLIIGMTGVYITRSVIPITFQAESLVMIQSLSDDMQERLSIVFFSNILLVLLSILGITTNIVDFAGDIIMSAMMTGVGFLLLKLSLDMVKQNRLLSVTSIISAIIIYLFFGNDLTYTIIGSLIISNMINIILNKKNISSTVDNNFTLKINKPILNVNIVRGALALTFLNIGTNIAYGSITSEFANEKFDLESLGIYTGLSNMISSILGGAPAQAVISATGSAPNPINSGLIMMFIMITLLLVNLLPKIGNYIKNQSIAGFLFVLGIFITIPNNAVMAFSGGNTGDNIVAIVTVGVTAFSDPFLGLLAGLILKILL